MTSSAFNTTKYRVPKECTSVVVETGVTVKTSAYFLLFVFHVAKLFAVANMTCLLSFLISQLQPILDATIFKEITDQGTKKAP